MQTETTPTADVEARVTSPRSARRVLLYSFLGVVLLLTLLMVTLMILGNARQSPLEQKMVGRWSCSQPAGDVIHYTFHADGTTQMVNTTTQAMMTHVWSASGTSFSAAENEEDWLTDLLQRWDGDSQTATFEVLFHDEDTFELYNGTPTGEFIFHRIKE